jgi:hypothetical protein
MMPATGRPDASATIAAWADVVIKMWRDRITEIPVMDTQQLFNSFQLHVIKQANGDLQRIEWMFNKYGIYQNYGKGSFNNATNREEKKWYSATFFREVMKIKEYMAFWYAENASMVVMEAFGQGNSVSAGSLKKQQYKNRNDAGFRQNLKDFGFANWKRKNK